MVSQRNNTVYSPDYAVPPGCTLKDVLADRVMTQKELSERTGISEKHISNIIKGLVQITPSTATELEKVLNVSSRFWLNLEANYQATLAEIELKEQLKNQVRYLSKYPYAEMAKQRWVKRTRNDIEKVLELLSFFGVSSFDKIQVIQEAAFRKARNRDASPEALSAWLRKGQLDAQDIYTHPFDRSKFIDALDRIKKLTAKLPSNFSEKVRDMCSDCGVAVVFVPRLEKTFVNGAAYWLMPHKAVIQLSLRYPWEDIFWFTFLHEAMHILKHSKKECFIDLENDVSNEIDDEADRYARNFLIPASYYNSFVNNRDFSSTAINKFAGSLKISPAIIVGRLLHEKIVDYGKDYNEYKNLRKKFAWSNS